MKLDTDKTADKTVDNFDGDYWNRLRCGGCGAPIPVNETPCDKCGTYSTGYIVNFDPKKIDKEKVVVT